jgi:hypothetical protein
MSRPKRKQPEVRSVKQHVRQNTKQTNRQSIVIHLGTKGRKRRNPPLRSSNRGGLEVKHVHYYNTPTLNPLIREDNEAVRKMRAEINELKAERNKNNKAKAKTAETATSFTQTNPILNKSTPPAVPKPPETPETNHPPPVPPVTPLKRKNLFNDDENPNKYQMYEYSSENKRKFENEPIRKPPNPLKKKSKE